MAESQEPIKFNVSFTHRDSKISQNEFNLLREHGFIERSSSYRNELVILSNKLLKFFYDFAGKPNPQKDLSLLYGFWLLKQVPRLEFILKFLNERPYSVYKEIEENTNHKADYTLKQLLKMQLIDKPHKGIYQINDNGRNLLGRIEIFEKLLNTEDLEN